MNATIHDLRLTNRVTITLIFNLERESWIIIHDNSRTSINGSMALSGAVDRERSHHHFWINTREYELVVDPTEDGKAWDTFSFFDIKKQSYIEGAQGSI
jgi:hypothetical protein